MSCFRNTHVCSAAPRERRRVKVLVLLQCYLSVYRVALVALTLFRRTRIRSTVGERKRPAFFHVVSYYENQRHFPVGLLR